MTAALPIRCMVAVFVLWAASLASQPAAAPPDDADVDGPRLLLTGEYPVEASVSFHAALLHWMDSLAALNPPMGTAGKTLPAHRLAYKRALGEPSTHSVRLLEGFRDARAAFTQANPRDPQGLTEAFFGAASLDEALERSAGLLGLTDAAALRAAVLHFATGYRGIWNDGEIPRTFLERAGKSRQRKELTRFIARVARFYGVDLDHGPRPRLMLAPVDDGFGTHAQAVGRFLLIEVRHREGLLDEVAPIVHENAHFLYKSMGPARTEALREVAARAGGSGPEAWGLLAEALPTAIAQGVADERFRRGGWSIERPWYHVDAIDTYAKRIFPVVREALHNGGSLDEPLLRKLLAAF